MTTSLAPVYRYFTADLLTNRIIAEIPFENVSYERTLGGAGKFSGRIPMIKNTEHLNLWETTIPGQTALYVMRNGKCVWGGIIWGRNYRGTEKEVSVSASEFTSYFYHRNIWKTWNHQYGGTLTQDEDGEWVFILDNGSAVAVNGGSTVRLDFYEPSNFKYSGFYRVSDTPAPTTEEFYLDGGAVADVDSYEVTPSYLVLYTREDHGYNTGDSVRLRITEDDGEGDSLGEGYSQSHKIEVPNNIKNVIRIKRPSGLTVTDLRPVEGTTSRSVPNGTYESVTLTVRMDAYDYVRTLLQAVARDFVTLDFPNVYIEPGISFPVEVSSKRVTGGTAIIETAEAHNLTPGQAVQIQDVDRSLDGEWEVGETPTPTTLTFTGVSKEMSTTPVSVKRATITRVQLVNGIATYTTSSVHGLAKGNNVDIVLNEPYAVLSGTFKIASVPSASKFTVINGSKTNIPDTALPAAVSKVSGKTTHDIIGIRVQSGNVVVTTRDPMDYAVGDSVTLENVSRTTQIREKSYDAPNDIATVQTTEAHGLRVGDSVTIAGAQDAVSINSVESTTSRTKFTTSRAHNMKKSRSVTITGSDVHRITNISMSGGNTVLTTSTPHNIPVGQSIEIESINEIRSLASARIVNGTAEVKLASTPTYGVGATIKITGASDTYQLMTVRVDNGTIQATTRRPHNLLVGSKIEVSGIGRPFNGKEFKITKVTSTSFWYKVSPAYIQEEKKKRDTSYKAWLKNKKKGRPPYVPVMTIPERKVSSGSVKVVDSFYNGNFTVTGVSGATVKFFRGGNDLPWQTKTGKISASSPVNGKRTVTARTASTVTVTGVSGSYSAAIAAPKKESDPTANIETESVYEGSYTIVSTTPTSITVNKSLPSAVSRKITLRGVMESVFNGNRTITAIPTPDRFQFIMSGLSNSMVEQTASNVSTVRANIYSGTKTITSVDTINGTFSYSAAGLPTYGQKAVVTRGETTVTPMIIVSTFGPYPGNADIGIRFEDQDYNGINIEPALYRGFELKSVGSALDSFANNIDGFEYRIDCAWDSVAGEFTKTFIMLPITYPDAPPPGEASPPERFNANRFTFEYPGGNITDFDFEESAEEAATRFFVSGETDLGPEVGPNIGIASSEPMLRGDRTGRKWPLLDMAEDIDGVDDENALYAQARRYLSDSAPPLAGMNLTVNGSLEPVVGSYAPGDWCKIVIDDMFSNARLASGIEPRNDFYLRKITSIKVKVPDGTTYPETISLTVMPEWEVDDIGK